MVLNEFLVLKSFIILCSNMLYHETRKFPEIVFFDIRGLVHHEFVPTGQMVNKEFYLNVLRRFLENIRSKRPELWANKLSGHNVYTYVRSRTVSSAVF